MCDAWRADWNNVNRSKDADIKDALGAVMHLRNNDTVWWNDNEPVTYDITGRFPDFPDYVAHASTINLVKMARIYKLDPRIFSLWVQGLSGRRAERSINVMVGMEAQKLCNVLANWDISSVERTRLHLKHDEMGGRDTVRMDLCEEFANRGTCKHGDDCKYIHARRKK